MNSLFSQQRCLNHAGREAVARCPVCHQCYCRECVTEHDDRLICAACLKKAFPPLARRRFRLARVLRAGQCALGMLTAWLFFYWMGQALLSIPTSFPEGTVWQAGWWESECIRRVGERMAEGFGIDRGSRAFASAPAGLFRFIIRNDSIRHGAALFLGGHEPERAGPGTLSARRRVGTAVSLMKGWQAVFADCSAAICAAQAPAAGRFPAAAPVGAPGHRATGRVVLLPAAFVLTPFA